MFYARCFEELKRFGVGSELPLPVGERVGVRGLGLSIGYNPSPGTLTRADLSPWER
jgi:hypothetical protein